MNVKDAEALSLRVGIFSNTLVYNVPSYSLVVMLWVRKPETIPNAAGGTASLPNGIPELSVFH